ncbi:MAG: ABC transporter permease [Blautia sp.]|nr:ABC transporter permease [Blautia sp.]MCM1200947.1 ABC transporter permease [Bacteroides fragilis]
MKKAFRRVLILLGVMLINVFFLTVEYTDDISTELDIVIRAEKELTIQAFMSETMEFDETQSQTVICDAEEDKTVAFKMPVTTKYLRLDFEGGTDEIFIKKLCINYKTVSVDLIQGYQNTVLLQNMLKYDGAENGIRILCTGNDAYVVYDLSSVELDRLLEDYAANDNFRKKIILCVAFDLICIICYVQRRKLTAFLLEIMGNRGLLLDLAKNDFKTKYAGSYLGIIWAFIQPVVTILVYWFVFQVGFRSGAVDGAPFVLWLTAGLVPWFFFNEVLNSATGSLLDYSYLVKKVVFNIEVIPSVRIVSSLFVHVFFVMFMLFIFLLNGISPSLAWLQLIYYSFCLVMLVMGITYLTSALVIFFRDLAQIIVVVLQVAMWMTPILWNSNMLSDKLQIIFKINPLYYIIQGYRDALMYHKYFWDSEYQTVYFWIFTLICLYIGTGVFNKLKDHFSDVI